MYAGTTPWRRYFGKEFIQAFGHPSRHRRRVTAPGPRRGGQRTLASYAIQNPFQAELKPHYSNCRVFY